MKLSWVSLVLCSLLAFDASANCLEQVAEFASNICGQIKTSGYSSVVEANGELKAEVSGIVRKVLGNAEGNINGRAATEAYENVLRNDLSKELFNIRECKIKMVDVGRSELCKPAPLSKTLFPAELVGTWSAWSVDNSDRLTQFTFRSNGTYDWKVEGRWPEGNVDREESGTVKMVERDSFILHPISGYTMIDGRQVDRGEVQYWWTVRKNSNGNEIVELKDHTGASVELVRRRR